MTSVFRISLDIHQTQSQVSIPASMGADNVRLIIRLTEKGNPFEIDDGSYAIFSAVKPDGNPLYNDCAIYRNSTIVYDFTKQTTAVEGITKCQIHLYDPYGHKLHSPRFQIVVHPEIYGKEIESTTEYSALEAFIQAKGDMELDIAANASAITALKEKVTTAGSVTIPVSQWEDDSPTTASFTIEGLGNGMTALLYPIDKKSKDEAIRVKMSANPMLRYVEGDTIVEAIIPSADNVPTIPIDLNYIIIKSDNSDEWARAVIIGVDAYGGVDEEAVRKIIEENADPKGTAKDLTDALKAEVDKKIENFTTGTEVNKKIGEHNVSTNSHGDIRNAIAENYRLIQNLLGADEETVATLQELLKNLEEHKTDAVTVLAGKVDKSNIVMSSEALQDGGTDKVVSAAVGLQIWNLIKDLEEGKATPEQVSEAISNALKEYIKTADADKRYADKTSTETTLTEHGGKIADLEKALEGSTVESAESLEWLEQYGDKSKTYVLPDGYKYTYRAETVEVIYNANTAEGEHPRLVDKFPGGTYGDGYPASVSGVLTSALIPIDPTKVSPDATNRDESLVEVRWTEIEGDDTKEEDIFLYPLYKEPSKSSIWTDYYNASGTRIMANKGSVMTGIGTDAEINLPLSYQLCNPAHFAASNWADVAGVRISIGVNPNGDVTEEQLDRIKILATFLKETKEVYGWYSTGELNSDDPAVQENAKNIADLQERMAAVEEELEQSGVSTEPLFAKLGLIGDSLTNQTTQGWQELAVSMLGGPEWHKNAVTGSSVANYGDGRESGYTPFVERYLNTPSDCDCIVIMGGSNDATYQYNYELGTVGVLANNTYKGAYCTIIEGLLERNPATRIMLMTPPRLYTAQKVLSTHIQKYVEATKEIAKYYGLPCLDLYYTLGWNDKTAAWCSANFAGDDPVHFSKAIGPRVGRMVANFIRRYY